MSDRQQEIGKFFFYFFPLLRYAMKLIEIISQSDHLRGGIWFELLKHVCRAGDRHSPVRDLTASASSPPFRKTLWWQS